MLLRGMVIDWPAYTLWKGNDYIEKKTGDIIITVERTDKLSHDFAYFKKNDKFSKVKMKYS